MNRTDKFLYITNGMGFLSFLQYFIRTLFYYNGRLLYMIDNEYENVQRLEGLINNIPLHRTDT